MTHTEIAVWLDEHGWHIVACAPRVVSVTRGKDSRRTYTKIDGVWIITARRGKRFWPGSWASDQEEAS